MRTVNAGIHPPRFQQGHIRVFEIGSTSNYPWAVALTSMALLLPKNVPPNRLSWSDEEWEKIAVTVPTTDSNLCETGTLVVLDTGET